MVLPPQRRTWPPPYIGKVLKENVDSWHHGLSPSSHQDRLESILLALKGLVDTGLGVASVLTNLHHRRIAPLMETELRIYEMSEAANLASLARSRLLHDRFPQEYAATRARRAISLKVGRHSNDELWSFAMLPDAQAVSRLSSFPRPFATHRCDFKSSFISGGWPWTPHSQTRPRPGPEQPPAPRSDESRSGPRAGRRGASGGGSAGSNRARSTGCASSRGSPSRRP
jgi:hypothetical protein